MNETRKFFARERRDAADARLAEIVERVSEGVYRVQMLLTQQQCIAVRANPSDDFLPGTRVVLNMPSASRAVVGSTPVIVSRAPQEMRGLAGSSRDEASQRGSVPTIDKVDAITLDQGGAAVELKIYGTGFTRGPVYVDPAITDDASPVVTSTHITATPKASARMRTSPGPGSGTGTSRTCS